MNRLVNSPMTHPSHTMDWSTQRCTRCDRWSHTVEARLECRGPGVVEVVVGVDWFAINRSAG